MNDPSLIIRARRVVLPDRVAPASIHIHDERIISVENFDSLNPKAELIDAADDVVVMPGLVDTHVHINSPGRTEWEGFETATQAAAAGGVTTLVDMPLNSIPPTTTTAGLQAKLNAAEKNCFVDVGFWGGVVPGNVSELEPLKRAGVVGFKCFLVPSGVDEFPHVTEQDLRLAMRELTRLDALLIVHAELPGPIDEAAHTHGSPREYATFLQSRPRLAEDSAIDMMIRLSREFGTRVHIVHLSSADAIPSIREAQDAGVPITAETCPHYLHFSAEQIPAGATEYKCCPPIREADNREALWSGLAEKTVGFIVSDHSPCPGVLKQREVGDFATAWGGIASLQLRLPVVWTDSTRRGFLLSDLSQWLCAGPAAQVKLDRQKGAIASGYDADIVLWKPEQEFTVAASDLFHRHKISPYDGEKLKGLVQKTFLRGRKIYDEGQITGSAAGKFLLQSC